ncbi:MAG: NAD(P)H-dependent oxidoreductase subunit E [Dehalococcoidia bacterium]|nr:NAD(P)H-dependent oxidoreductase subunit E [Dehalococcoidia bacterium]
MTGVTALVSKVVESHHRDKDQLIQVLLDLQGRLGWLPQEALTEVGRQLRVPVTRIYQVASYYKAFSFAPKGRHTIKVCLGTACHVRGAARVLEKMETDLGIKRTETTPDLKYTLETVNCVGCCALGPMVMVDGQYHGQISSDKVSPLLEKYE